MIKRIIFQPVSLSFHLERTEDFAGIAVFDNGTKTPGSVGIGGVGVNDVNFPVCRRDGIWIAQTGRWGCKNRHGIRGIVAGPGD